MTDAEQSIWRQAAALFDELAPLGTRERNAILERRNIPREVRRWLDELLAAHDSDNTAIIDREIDQLVECLIPESRLTPQSAERLAGQSFGPWRATGELGRGGMGIVLSGERADGQFEMRVAIKLLDPAAFDSELAELFRREVRILAELSHPGIAQLLDGGLTDEGIPYLVMEYIDGQPIDQYCREASPDLDARLALFDDVADAVDYCHRHLVVHGDIKPGNVLVDGDGLVRLLDFGIASRLVREKGAGNVRMRWCSPGFAAPERFDGAAPAITEDVFALGALLYQLLTGARIRSAPEMGRLLQGEVPRDRPASASERARGRGVPAATVRRIRGDLDSIVLCALATRPGDRYASVRALLDDLVNWREGRPVSVRTASRAYRLGCWLRRHHITAAASTAVFIALTTGTSVALWQADQAHEQALRAEQSLAQTERALRRVTGLRDFIIDLFATVAPQRPRDELPSTREILEAGAKQVLGESDLAVGERFELMYTLGRIHESLYLREPAVELLEAAVALAREHEELPDEDLVHALRRLAWAVGGTGDLERAAELLEESLLRAREIGEESLEIRVAADRAYLRLALGEVENGLQQLQALEQQIGGMEKAPADLVFSVVNPLAIGLVMSGDLEAGVAAKQRAAGAARRAYGGESHRYAMTLANLANSQSDLGLFDTAQAGMEEAIERYDRLFGDEPAETRAAALTNLARISARRGQMDRALEQMKEGSARWARSMTEDPEQWPHRHLNVAWTLLRSHHWQAALDHLRRAEELFQQQSSPSGVHLVRSMALQGLVLCRLGRAEEGTNRLDSAGLIEGEGFQNHKFEAERLEAIAACRLGRKDWRDAIDAINHARTMIQPGWVLQRADLQLMAARALRALRGGTAAVAELDALQNYLDELALAADHPTRDWLSEFRKASSLPD